MAGKKAEQAMQALAGMVGDVGEAAPTSTHARSGGPVFTERGKLRETKVNRTPMADVSAEAVRDMLSTTEGVQRLLALTPKQQSLVRARLASANRAWADDFDEVLSSPEPKTAQKLDSGFEGPDADPDQEVVGLGEDDSLPSDPERVASPRRSMGNDRLLDRPSRKVGDASFPIAKQPEARAPYDRMSANAPFMAQKLPERRLALAQKAVREQVGQWLRATKPIDPSTKKPYTLDAYLSVASKQDIDRVVSGTPVGVRRRTSKVTGKDEIASGFVDDSQQTNRLEGGMASQEQRQADRVTRAAGTNPSGHSRTLRRDGGNGANTLTEDGFQEDVAQSSMPPLVSSRPAQGAHERAFDSVNALRDTFKEGADSMLVALRHADDDKAAELAYGAAHDIVNRMFPNTESMTAVARRDAVHGVATGLLSSVDRRINVLPKSVVDADLAAVRATNEAFPPVPRTPVPEPRPSRPLPMDDSWRSAATTRDIQPGPEARLPTPDYNGSGRKPPKNFEQLLADRRAGRSLDPEDAKALDDVIEARRQFLQPDPSIAPAEPKPTAPRKRAQKPKESGPLPAVPETLTATPVKTKGRGGNKAPAAAPAEVPPAPKRDKKAAAAPTEAPAADPQPFVGGARGQVGTSSVTPTKGWSAENEAAAEQVFRSTFKAAIDSGAEFEAARDAANAARKAKSDELYGAQPAAAPKAAAPAPKADTLPQVPAELTATPAKTKSRTKAPAAAPAAAAPAKPAANPVVAAEPTDVTVTPTTEAPAKTKRVRSKPAPAAETPATEASADPWELGRDGGDGLDDPAPAPVPPPRGQAVPPHVRARPAGTRPSAAPDETPWEHGLTESWPDGVDDPAPRAAEADAAPQGADGTPAAAGQTDTPNGAEGAKPAPAGGGSNWWGRAGLVTGGAVGGLVLAGRSNRNEQKTNVVDDLSANLGGAGGGDAADGGRDPITMLERIRLANKLRNGGASTLPLGTLGNAFIDASDFGGR
jgi:hypothetical protein